MMPEHFFTKLVVNAVVGIPLGLLLAVLIIMGLKCVRGVACWLRSKK